MTTIYALLERKGYKFEPSPRLNPRNLLNEPWRLLNTTGKTIRSAPTRDGLEEVAWRYWRHRYLGLSNR